MRIKLRRGDHIIQLKTGFSWTIFFFGGLPLIFRGMFRHFFIMWITCGLAGLYYIFMGNRLYIQKHLAKGYMAADHIAKAYIER